MKKYILFLALVPLFMACEKKDTVVDNTEETEYKEDEKEEDLSLFLGEYSMSGHGVLYSIGKDVMIDDSICINIENETITITKDTASVNGIIISGSVGDIKATVKGDHAHCEYLREYSIDSIYYVYREVKYFEIFSYDNVLRWTSSELISKRDYLTRLVMENQGNVFYIAIRKQKAEH